MTMPNIPAPPEATELHHRRFNKRDRFDRVLADFTQDLDHGLILNGLNIGERYLVGDVNVVIAADWRGCKYDFIFAPLPRGVSRFNLVSGIEAFHIGSNAKQFGVFVYYIKVMKGLKQVTAASIVWLQRFQKLTDGLGNFLAFTTEGKFESRLILPMREIRFVGRITRKLGADTNTLIKRAPKIVKSIGGDKRGVAVQWLYNPHNMLPPPCPEVILEGVGPGVRLDKRIIDGLKVRKVAFGPFNF